MCQHGIHGFTRETVDLPSEFLTSGLQEVFGEQRNIVGTLTQRRQFNVDYVHAVKKVLTEPAFGNGGIQVLVGG